MSQQKLEDILKQCYENEFVTRTVHFNKKKHFIENWMTSAILKSINNKNKLYTNLMINKELYEDMKTNFNTYKKY